MAYHNFCILVHRPWTSKSSQPRGKIGPGYQHARSVCRRSAAEIASLLRTYEASYGFRKMNVYAVIVIFSASVILIFGLVAEERQMQHEAATNMLVDGRPTAQTAQAAASTVVGDLNTCFRALDELGQSYECAKRTREHLLAIQRHWTQCKRDAQMGSKRSSRSLLPPGGQVASKRPRPSRELGQGSW